MPREYKLREKLESYPLAADTLDWKRWDFGPRVELSVQFSGLPIPKLISWTWVQAWPGCLHEGHFIKPIGSIVLIQRHSLVWDDRFPSLLGLSVCLSV